MSRHSGMAFFVQREAYAHTFVRESFRIAGIHYFVPKMPLVYQNAQLFKLHPCHG